VAWWHAEGERPLRLPHALTEEEMMKIIQSCIPTTALGLRDRAILELLYSTGIRRRELVNLTVSDFHLESRELLIANGKGGKDRVVPVGEWACYFTEAYAKNVRPWQVYSPHRESALRAAQKRAPSFPAGGGGYRGKSDGEERGGKEGQPAHLPPHDGNSHAA